MLMTVTEAKQKIENNEILLISGDESLLKQLPKGKWIGEQYHILWILMVENVLKTKSL